MTTYTCHVCLGRVSSRHLNLHTLLDLLRCYEELNVEIGLGWSNQRHEVDWTINIRKISAPELNIQRIAKIRHFSPSLPPLLYEWWFHPDAHPYQFSHLTHMVARVDELLDKHLLL